MPHKKILKLTQEQLEKILKEDNEKIKQLIEEQKISELLENLSIYQEELQVQNDELHQKEKELYLQKEQFKSMFINAPIAYIEVDLKGNIIHYNEMAKKFFKTKSSLDKNYYNINVFLDTQSILLYKDIIDKLENNKDINNIQELLSFNIKTSKFYGLTSISKNPQDNNFLIAIKDITSEKEQEHILLTQSRIASVGEMLGNIAHQWRQPLSLISTLASSRLVDIDLDYEVSKEQQKKDAQKILTHTNYLSKTIDDFRSFFMADQSLLEKTSLKDLFNSLSDLIDASFKDKFISYNLHVEEDIELYLNKNLLIQALLNIYNNAKDALVENVKNSDERLVFVNVIKLNNRVEITIQDSGGGIKENIVSKIFEPYFTTKEVSSGTGIGLYMTHQIITKHLKGTIEVSNTEFKQNNKKLKGAKFKILLPFNL